ncbi:hypothetical protein K466DRAFT_499733 [Polyporus arcularius HHB13444]|uniref:DNA helicase n=1 Tax=Polyporus arcularius HHB13444 TaxID=1314778 RepID=A0A5C3PAA1_9APHY|nr:hypothetical protein K466DRAFT_499733 [Polyporus arcularius HHB13444]
MCAAFKNDGVPFGGINMIFAGDFAQLPPSVNGKALYAHDVGWVIHRTHAHATQKASIGKAVWHQFTTVVILRENMRQRSQTPEDAKLRTALENLHYRACTDEDIKLIQSRVAGPGPHRPKLNQPRFRNVSVITSWNSDRDAINAMGCERFARENGQVLQTFYCRDKLAAESDSSDMSRRQRQNKVNPKRATNIVNPELQELLWNLSPELTEHHPGKLSICVGMPVMIKINVATECYVTNGAEGVVVGWTSRLVSEDKLALDTLFVKLTAAPSKVQVKGLPENVIPLVHQVRKVKCKLPNGKVIEINHDQVPVVPNFAMTDFASQGRTRPDNVCDIQNCKNHQSVYTCLSRGSTLDGTIIVQPFNASKLRGCIAGSLRQEFRELELLDQITKMRYLGEVPPTVVGITRNELIYSFRKWKGEKYMPAAVHSAIQWLPQDPFPLQDKSKDSPWTVLPDPKDKGKEDDTAKATTKATKKDTAGYVSARGTQALQSLNNFGITRKDKRKRDDQHDIETEVV